MPFTDDFNKIKRKFLNLYPENKAKAETLAFKEAFIMKVPTFQDRQKKFKIQIKKSIFDL